MIQPIRKANVNRGQRERRPEWGSRGHVVTATQALMCLFHCEGGREMRADKERGGHSEEKQ